MSQAIDEDAVVLPTLFFPFLRLREKPSSRDAAEAANFAIDIAKDTVDVLTKFLPDDSVVAARLRELLPKRLDAAFRERMRQYGVGSSVLYRFHNGSGLSRENLERIADALERPDLVAGPEIPAHELRGDVLKAAVDFDRRGEREVAQSARAWCERVADAVFTGRADSGCELSDLPDGICELALVFYRGRIATAKEQARARPVTPAAIRKRWSRAGAVRAAPGP